MSRKSSFIRLGSELLKPKEGEDKAKESELERDREDKRPPGAKNWLIGLPLIAVLILCVALCVICVVFYFSSAKSETLLEIRNQVSSLKIESDQAREKSDYALARKSLLSALDKCREYQAIRSDSFIATEIQDIENALKSPAIARGEPGAREERVRMFDSALRELPPPEIIVRLKDKARPVVEEYLHYLSDEETEKLLSQRLSALLSQFIQSKSEEEVRKVLGAKLDEISRNRVREMTIETLISLLGDKLDELTRRHLERVSYDSERLAKILSNMRESIVREYIDGQPEGEVAKLVAARIEEIEKAVKELIASRRATITLKDRNKLSGQILEEYSDSLKFKTDDGELRIIRKEDIDKIERAPKPEPPK
jgi:hypothetical protein